MERKEVVRVCCVGGRVDMFSLGDITVTWITVCLKAGTEPLHGLSCPGSVGFVGWTFLLALSIGHQRLSGGDRPCMKVHPRVRKRLVRGAVCLVRDSPFLTPEL